MTANGRVLVINPNSNADVTAAMDAELDPLRVDGGLEIESITLEGTPLGIESQRDVEAVVRPLCDVAQQRENDAAAFVIACFSDPGLHAVRETTTRPVFGIAASGLLTALGIGNAIGIISILHTSVPRHWRYVRALGISDRVADDRPVDLSVAALSDPDMVEPRMIEVGRTLRDESGADVLVLGCAGMARYRTTLQASLGIPVVDPVQAATAMAIHAAQVGYVTVP